MKKRVAKYLSAKEKTDPVPLKSRVAFKRPLSAHERVLRALKQHDILKRLDSGPGDDSFDTPIEDIASPHQLMTDPVSGEEMTAGEYVMLQHERAGAAKDIEQLAQKRVQRKLPGKAGKPKAAKGESADSTAESETNELGEE